MTEEEIRKRYRLGTLDNVVEVLFLLLGQLKEINTKLDK